jgi:hypothetical protein
MLETTTTRAQGASPWKRLGKIKLGIKVDQGGGKSYPKDLEYFVIPDRFKAKLGAEPTELSIVLAFPRLEQNFDSRAAWYKNNGAKACWTLDDKTAHRYMKPDGAANYQWVTMECPALACEFRQRKLKPNGVDYYPSQCSERGHFSFMIPAAGEIGTFFMKMGSKTAIDRIYTALKAVEGLTINRNNGMFGIRMKLRRERTEFMVDLKGDGLQSKIVKFIPTLDIDFEALMVDDRNLLAPFIGQALALPPAQITAADLEEEEDHDDDEEPAPRLAGGLTADEIPFGNGPGTQGGQS